MYERSVTVSRRLGGDISTKFARKEFSNNFCTRFVHFVDAGTAVDLGDFVLFVVILDNRHTGLFVNIFEECKFFG